MSLTHVCSVTTLFMQCLIYLFVYGISLLEKYTVALNSWKVMQCHFIEGERMKFRLDGSDNGAVSLDLATLQTFLPKWMCIYYIPYRV